MDNSLFPFVRLRRQPDFLILQVSVGDFFKSVFARRVVAENASLFNAQKFSRADILRLRDIRGVSLTAAPASLRVSPAYPPAGAIGAPVTAVSFLGCLLRHYFALVSQLAVVFKLLDVA